VSQRLSSDQSCGPQSQKAVHRDAHLTLSDTREVVVKPDHSGENARLNTIAELDINEHVRLKRRSHARRPVRDISTYVTELA